LHHPATGPASSPVNFLCYASQSIAGTEIKEVSSVADLSSCASVCDETPGCTLSQFYGAANGLCVLKSSPFTGDDGVFTGTNPLVSGVCLAAPGAPQILSGMALKWNATKKMP